MTTGLRVVIAVITLAVLGAVFKALLVDREAPLILAADAPRERPPDGEIDDAGVADLDRALVEVLTRLYHGARRTAWRREDGPDGPTFTLNYAISDAHTLPAALIEAELTAHDFRVERAQNDPIVTTISAVRGELAVTLTAEVGTRVIVARVERSQPPTGEAPGDGPGGLDRLAGPARDQ